MRKTVISFALCAMLFALCSSAEAQQSGKIPRVGILFIGGRDQPHLQSFKEGLRERGYTEGKNIKLEYKYAEGKQERLDELAAEFVRDKVDIIVTTASVSALAARKVTQIIPIIMTSGSPIETGLAKSLARPGGMLRG
jgi:putative tryptophan/tyrosine transport system substrate-binding protein